MLKIKGPSFSVHENGERHGPASSWGRAPPYPRPSERSDPSLLGFFTASGSARVPLSARQPSPTSMPADSASAVIALTSSSSLAT